MRSKRNYRLSHETNNRYIYAKMMYHFTMKPSEIAFHFGIKISSVVRAIAKANDEMNNSSLPLAKMDEAYNKAAFYARGFSRRMLSSGGRHSYREYLRVSL